MIAFFIENINAKQAISIFKDEKCSLRQLCSGEFYASDCLHGASLTNKRGTLISNSAGHTLLFPKGHDRHPELMWDFKPISFVYNGHQVEQGVWMGESKNVEFKKRIEIPNMR